MSKRIDTMTTNITGSKSIKTSDNSAFVRFERTKTIINNDTDVRIDIRNQTRDYIVDDKHSFASEYDEENQNHENTTKQDPVKKTLFKRKEAFAQIKEMFGISKRKILPCCTNQ